jgi:hypothetical protein
MVTIGHFGQDSITGYNGEMFEITWKVGLELFHVSKKKPGQKIKEDKK